jgi:hypothetical protein
MLHHAIDTLLDDGVDPRTVCYLSVDHPLYNDLSLDHLLEHYAQATDTEIGDKPTYVFFDEIQYLRHWERYLKSLVDRLPHLRCVVSGSAAAALQRASQESGAGRFTDFLLPPLTFHEYLDLLGLADLVRSTEDDKRPGYEAVDIEELNKQFIDYLNFGGYP